MVLISGLFSEDRDLRNLWAESTTLYWSLWLRQALTACIPYRILQEYFDHLPVYLQGTLILRHH